MLVQGGRTRTVFDRNFRGENDPNQESFNSDDQESQGLSVPGRAVGGPKYGRPKNNFELSPSWKIWPSEDEYGAGL